MAVDLIVPLKQPSRAKTRLRLAFPPAGSDRARAELVLALAFDTLRAATSAAGIRRVVVVTSDTAELLALRELPVDLVGENDIPAGDPLASPATTGPQDGLNAALRAGERVLRAEDPGGVVGALQADLPALRPEALTVALAEADGHRAFVADRHHSGTTLLLSAPGAPLDPRFGVGSAPAHERSGARPLSAPLPSLRTDVDTREDLDRARLLGLGERSRAVLDRSCLLF